jgi:clan AA aspartic protease
MVIIYKKRASDFQEPAFYETAFIRIFKKNDFMGLVYADITLINGEDLILAKRNIIGEDEIKTMTVNMLVDSGAYMMAINESIQEQLKLPLKEKRKAQMANGSIEEYEVVGPIEVKFKNRRCTIDARVLPGNNEPLLGSIPKEDMDVLIHPLRQELIVNPEHPYFAQMKMK